jgi:bifunctional UDP-N-acetylglucosamine pyrophosphorylase/glucosamine-1-phosphate N-acetyltransferase
VSIAAVVLAAGRGTRFRSERPKVLHAAAGRTLLAHVLHALAPLDCQRLVVVVGHGADEVTAEVVACARALGRDIEVVVQPEQRGTGDAAAIALDALAASGPSVERVLVVPGDTPLVRASTFADLVAAAAGVDVAMLSANVLDPTGYGRILRDAAGAVVRIVEHRDADEHERTVDEINAGMYVADREALARALEGVGDHNDQGERYLTDAITALVDGGARVVAIAASADEVAGVNDRVQLADAGAVLRARHLDHLMREVGVTVIDPSTTYVDVDVSVGADTVLMPGTVLDGATTIGSGCTIGPNAHLTGCAVGEHVKVHSSRADGATIGDQVSVGPFTHLRPGTRLG